MIWWFPRKISFHKRDRRDVVSNTELLGTSIKKLLMPLGRILPEGDVCLQ